MKLRGFFMARSEEEKIKVSIVIPVYNTSKFLEKSILSALNQTYKNTQIIVINDGSTDNSEDLITSLLINNKFEYYKKENGGLSSARNYGLNYVNGDYVFFLDSDDFIEPDAIETLVCQSKGFDIVVGKYRYVYENNQFKEAEDFQLQKFEKDVPNEAEAFVYMFGEKSGLNACNKLIRVSLIRNSHILFQPTKEILAEDMLFNLKLLGFKPKFRTVNHITYNYYQNNSSLTHTYAKGLADRYSNLIKDYCSDIHANKILLVYVICNGINSVCGQNLGFCNGLAEINKLYKTVKGLIPLKVALKIISHVPYKKYRIDYSVSYFLLGRLNIALYYYQKVKRIIWGAHWLK